MYTNVVQHYNCQPQNNFSTLNITLISAAICVNRRQSIVLLVDSSGSIVEKGASNWDLMKGFAIDLIRHLVNRNAEVATVIFSDNAENVQQLTRYVYLLGQTFFILWFTDIFAPYPMSGFGIKIKFQ